WLMAVASITFAPRSTSAPSGPVVASRLVTTTFASLGTPANGSVRYCSDCAATAPCTGSGSGAEASRVNGAWNCSTGGSSGGVASGFLAGGNGGAPTSVSTGSTVYG